VSAVAQRPPAELLRAAHVRHPRIEADGCVAGLDPEALAAAFGSPLFVYDLDALAARVALLRAALPAAIDLAFAVKANPSLAVLAHLAGLGVGADVASGGELDAAVRAGIPVDRIVFTGPGKTDAELGRALRLGIRALTLESLDELDVAVDLAGLAHPNQGLLLRLAVGDSMEERPIIGGAGPAKFGLLADEIDEGIDRLHRAGAIGGAGAPFRLLGLHAFGASNVLDPDVITGGVGRLATCAEEVGRRHGLAIALLDGGGGLGIPYRDDRDELDLSALAGGLAQEIATWPSRGPLARTRLLLEPGRFLAGPIGAFVVRVVRTKRRSGRTIAVVDGGIHHLLRPTLMGETQQVVAVGAATARPLDWPVDVVGPLCTGLDVLASAAALPAPRPGDLLAILDAGAYGFSESMPWFLSHPQPAEVVVSRGRAHLARPRLDPGEWLERQSPGPWGDAQPAAQRTL
jgi:diaminopimelate decarboxylase